MNRNDIGAPPSTPPAVTALAAKLNLRPEALVPLLDGGSLPASTAARLEQALSTGQDLGRRLGLTGPKADSASAVMVSYTLRTMLAERMGAMDPARAEELRSETLATFRDLGGEEAVREASREIDQLYRTR